MFTLPSTSCGLAHRRPNRRGATLIDVATGSMLLAVLLIPSIHLISESQSSHRRLEVREVMLYEAEQLLESTRVALSEPVTFDTTMSSPVDAIRNISATDCPNLVGRVQVAPDPTLPTARLLNINVEVWQDIDGDTQLDSGELSESMRTQWSAP